MFYATIQKFRLLDYVMLYCYIAILDVCIKRPDEYLFAITFISVCKTYLGKADAWHVDVKRLFYIQRHSYVQRHFCIQLLFHIQRLFYIQRHVDIQRHFYVQRHVDIQRLFKVQRHFYIQRLFYIQWHFYVQRLSYTQHSHKKRKVVCKLVSIEYY